MAGECTNSTVGVEKKQEKSVKKVFASLFCAFVVVGCAVTDNTPTTENALYEIDPIATAKAPWSVGERIGPVSCLYPEMRGLNPIPRPCYRVFEGVTRQGFRIIQDFYADGSKASELYLVHPTVSFSDIADSRDYTSYIDVLYGAYKGWYPNGSIFIEFVVDDRYSGIVRRWHENGKMSSEIEFIDREIIRENVWDLDGNPIRGR